MALSDFTPEIANVVAFQGGAFVSDDAGTTWYDLGGCTEIEWNLSSMDSEADTSGRTVALLIDISGTITIQQTTKTELQALGALAQPSGTGFWLKLTEPRSNAAGAGAAAGVTFKNVFFTFPQSSLSHARQNRSIQISFQGTVARTAFDSFETTPEIVFGA